MMGMCGFAIALVPSILSLDVTSVWSDLCLAAAGALVLWSLLGLAVEFDEIKTGLSGIEQEGWGYLIIAAALLAPAGVFISGAQILDAPAWTETSLLVTAIPLFILGVVFVAVALDSLFIKPRLKKLSRQGGKSKAERNSLIGGVATAATWMLSNAASLLAILERLSNG